jgi:uncharacterized membrane protein YbaN (DUF454 family)
VFGPPLKLWLTHRVIPTNAKLLAVVTMVLSIVYLALFTEVNVWIKGLTAVVMLYGAVFILSKPSHLPN